MNPRGIPETCKICCHITELDSRKTSYISHPAGRKAQERFWTPWWKQADIWSSWKTLAILPGARQPVEMLFGWLSTQTLSTQALLARWKARSGTQHRLSPLTSGNRQPLQPIILWKDLEVCFIRIKRESLTKQDFFSKEIFACRRKVWPNNEIAARAQSASEKFCGRGESTCVWHCAGEALGAASWGEDAVDYVHRQRGQHHRPAGEEDEASHGQPQEACPSGWGRCSKSER